MKHKLFERLHKLFGAITADGWRSFIKRRLPIYVIAAVILVVGGVRALVITLGLVLAFFLGWTLSRLWMAVKDWRLTQRLNRVHFTHIEFDNMKRERDMALKAFEVATSEKGSRGVKAAPMPPTPPGPLHRTIDPDTLREYLRQSGMEV